MEPASRSRARPGWAASPGGAASALAMVLAGAGCAGALSYDGSSVSVGWHGNGALRRGAELAASGDGYRVGEPWRQRGSQFGTDEVVSAVVRVARAVERGHPHTVLAIGDLSHRAGGGSPEHRSHQSGRDFDVFLPALDASGRAVVPGDVMLHFDGTGRAVSWSAPDGTRPPAAPVPSYRLDRRRAWRVVRGLLEDPALEVQWIFVQKELAALILEQGAGEDPALLARAAFVVRQPSDAEPHDDHMHVRAYCDPADRPLGCIDHGPVRWLKKEWKFMRPPFASGREPDLGSRLGGVLGTRVPVARLDPGAAS